jgi:hypothetical protein
MITLPRRCCPRRAATIPNDARSRIVGRSRTLVFYFLITGQFDTWAGFDSREVRAASQVFTRVDGACAIFRGQRGRSLSQFFNLSIFLSILNYIAGDSLSVPSVTSEQVHRNFRVY